MSEAIEAPAPAAPVSSPAIISNSSGDAYTGIEATMAEVYEKNNPSREANGQFKGAAKEAVADVAESADTGEPAAEETPTEEPIAETTEPAEPAIPRPQAWSSDVDELWSKLPPDAQKLIARRESEATKRISEQGETVKAYEPIRPYLEPLRRASSRMGVDAGKGLEMLLAADDYLARDPAAAIQWLAQASGVDLSVLGQQPRQDTPLWMHKDEANIDAFQRDRQKIANLEQQLSELHHRYTDREQRELQSQQTSLEQLVEKFAEGKDYWGDIENGVIEQIRALKASQPGMDPRAMLEEAHSRAVKLNDDVSKRVNEAKRKAEASKKEADDKRKAADAKRLASLNVKSVEGKAPSPSRKSLEDEMADIYDRVASRG